jgi:hypothetical protein
LPQDKKSRKQRRNCIYKPIATVLAITAACGVLDHIATARNASVRDEGLTAIQGGENLNPTDDPVRVQIIRDTKLREIPFSEEIGRGVFYYDSEIGQAEEGTAIAVAGEVIKTRGQVAPNSGGRPEWLCFATNDVASVDIDHVEIDLGSLGVNLAEATKTGYACVNHANAEVKPVEE